MQHFKLEWDSVWSIVPPGHFWFRRRIYVLTIYTEIRTFYKVWKPFIMIGIIILYVHFCLKANFQQTPEQTKVHLDTWFWVRSRVRKVSGDWQSSWDSELLTDNLSCPRVGAGYGHLWVYFQINKWKCVNDNITALYAYGYLQQKCMELGICNTWWDLVPLYIMRQINKMSFILKV